MDPTKMAKVGGGVSGLGLIVFLIQQLMAIAGTQATVLEAVTTIKQDVKTLKSENKVLRERVVLLMARGKFVHGEFEVPFGVEAQAEAEQSEAEAAAASDPPSEPEPKK